MTGADRANTRTPLKGGVFVLFGLSALPEHLEHYRRTQCKLFGVRQSPALTIYLRKPLPKVMDMGCRAQYSWF